VDFLVKQVGNALKLQGLSQIMNITLIPYGNCVQTQRSGKWYFACQHGPKECTANAIQTCAIDKNGYVFSRVFPFIYCMESSSDILGSAQKCAQQTSQDWNAINACAQGTQGNNLEHHMGVLTEALSPQHNYVPWVTINGQHSPDAENDLVKVVCRTYTGSLPPGCPRERVGCPREEIAFDESMFV
jgi:interferon gamma-inducible protein 30